MKGYVFALDDKADVRAILSRGSFGVRQPAAQSQYGPAPWDPASWKSGQIETFADWQTIAPGDLIFFFQGGATGGRVFGVGKALGLDEHPRQAALCNYAESERSVRERPLSQDAILGQAEDTEWHRVRVVVLFEPGPAVFNQGIHMDEALSSYFGEPWPMHYWAGKSFVQLLEQEAKILRDTFLRRFAGRGAELPVQPSKAALLQLALTRGAVPFSTRRMINWDPTSYVKGLHLQSEYLLHAALAEELQLNSPGSPVAHASWADTYHELPVSPPKNPDWVNRLDLLSTVVWPDTEAVTEYHIFELKNGRVGVGSVNTFERIISQPMKYLDFVGRHYAGNNLHAIGIHYIATSFAPRLSGDLADTTTLPRSYTLSEWDPLPIRRWQRIRFWRYSWNGRLVLELEAERWSDSLST